MRDVPRRGLRAVTVTLGCLLYVASGALGARVQADDWLALLPACSIPEQSAPALELVYPEPDLPAVVAAGDTLVARVRVPAALTPPPGVQQERALRGWSAELRGGGIPFGAAALDHRHTLFVTAVRPDTGSSLVYRIRLEVPAYAAPGPYDFWLRTPFGERHAAGAVVVMSAGAGLRPKLPTVAIAERALALRVDGALWVSEGCASDGFSADVLTLLASERRTRVELNGVMASAEPDQVRDLAEVARLGWHYTRAELEANNTLEVARQVLVLLPARSRVQVDGGRLELYPASDLSVKHLAAISGVLTLAPHARARLTLGSPRPRVQVLSLAPAQAQSGTPTRVRVVGTQREARVAYDYGFGRTAWNGPEFWADFSGPVPQPLRALVLTPANGGELVRQRLSVVPQRPPSCTVTSTPGVPETARAGGLLWAGLLGLGALLKTRPTARFGNRLRRRRRCPRCD